MSQKSNSALFHKRFSTRKVSRENTNSKSSLWLFGIHAVRAALENPNRVKHKLISTPNAFKKISSVIQNTALKTDIVDTKKFAPPIEKHAVHQGMALEVEPLNWGSITEICRPSEKKQQMVLLLDRVTDPNNVGAIIRTAEVFGALAVIAPMRHSAAETGALAKSASGSLERQPYLRVSNLVQTINKLKTLGYWCVGLDRCGTTELEETLNSVPTVPIALIVGAEGPGMRELTVKNCDEIVAIKNSGSFGSLNVSNAAAIAMFLAHSRNTCARVRMKL